MFSDRFSFCESWGYKPKYEEFALNYEEFALNYEEFALKYEEFALKYEEFAVNYEKIALNYEKFASQSGFGGSVRRILAPCWRLFSVFGGNGGGFWGGFCLKAGLFH
ncbi:hypothetical protein KFZ76_22055 [Methylovulum psychrotolerans]|uniref:hypothetical protein n=1 Tax=Methylovulum psychrotolerans TaxID=1704499 RepID=UPI001BFF4A54|nr:hypothetical protein [Methylovulum psychrotolerans]MBT9100384.1 hypothetical protein [Methylovulum psychrotolerans]